MIVLLRAAASEKVGNGHLIRCINLAIQLRKLQVSCKFLCYNQETQVKKTLRKSQLEYITLDGEETSFSEAEKNPNGEFKFYDSQAIADFERHVEKIKPDLLIIDDYNIDITYESIFRPHVGRLMVIDDLANRKHDCDILLDQNLFREQYERYQNLIPSHCITLYGPLFALLAEEYSTSRKSAVIRSGAPKNILICFGGHDPYNLSEKILRGLLSISTECLNIHLAISSSNKNISSINAATEGAENVRIHFDLPSLQGLISTADLAFGATGITTWERCCLGLPSAIITFADNHVELAETLHELGFVFLIGHYPSVDDAYLRDRLEYLLHKLDIRTCSEKCFGLVDGLGAETVALILTLGKRTTLDIRDVTPKDESYTYSISNDCVTRKYSLNKGFISREEHTRWFMKTLKNKNILYYIISASNRLTIGQVRFENTLGKWRIHFSLANYARALGFGLKMLELAMERFYQEIGFATIFAEVVSGNTKSKKLLERLNFKVIEDGDTITLKRNGEEYEN
ncbi:UDP-2,4-diacetamido-2,4,6-trideoxy-beta-L-altropyranose hydrolase [Betaproteobacteria bacterium LSUCC0117]|nr:UDP-2,4-diacetamido-2,4,6-trideoxy-beta-L-altropyranose hydrolase [Betaproteobacteria bacterium LSUCC0117]